jgi:hypothetical protein
MRFPHEQSQEYHRLHGVNKDISPFKLFSHASGVMRRSTLIILFKLFFHPSLNG